MSVMSFDPLVTLARFSFPHEVPVFMGLLASRHVPAFIMHEPLITMQWRWETALGGVKVQVSPQDLEAAHEVLIDYQAHRLAEAATQPEHSLPRSKMRFYGWRALAIVSWAATGVVFPLPESRVTID